MDLIAPGKKAPAFSLNDQAGKTHRLADYAGKPVVLFFYPKDDTPGCTKEACAFQENLPGFKTNKAAVLGISVLDEASKARFAKKCDLSFPLLADEDHAVADKYGVWQKKSFLGRKYMGSAVDSVRANSDTDEYRSAGAALAPVHRRIRVSARFPDASGAPTAPDPKHSRESSAGSVR